MFYPDLTRIQFIGSSHVGRLLAIEAAKHLKPCMMELGGKAPAIVRILTDKRFTPMNSPFP